MRVVFWTNEENGLKGANKYAENRSKDVDNHAFAIESDAGTFAPQGFDVEGSDSARAVVREICTLLGSIGATSVEKGFAGADVSPLTAKGVPGAGLKVAAEKYFWYHHTDADTMDKLDADELNRCAATLGVLAFIAADLPFRIPR
jgi:carboxypeptidase Q